jgi:hypothetical protein
MVEVGESFREGFMRHQIVRARLKGVVVATVAVLGVTTLTTAPLAEAEAAKPGAPPRPGGTALTWAPTHMSDVHEYSRRQALRIARRFDLVSADSFAFAEHSRAMRRVNPDITIIAYVNGTLAKPHKVRHLPERAFAHDSNGRRITSPIWGTTLMAPTSRAWRREVNGVCRRRVKEGHYDGCLVDSMGLGIFAPSQRFTGIPVNPATGEKYTQRQYRAAQAKLADYFRAASPGLVHVFNVVENDWRYWRDPVRSRPLALGRPAVHMENFLRAAQDGANDFPNAEKWLRNVRVVRDLEKHNVAGLFATKLWSSHSDAQAAQWQAFAMASFLMGAKGNTYFAFTRSRDRAGATGRNAPYSMPNGLGRPVRVMVQRESGAYVRRFEHGLAVVNPGTTSVTVRLPHAMRRLNGNTVTSIQLGPRQGDVLKSVS